MNIAVNELILKVKQQIDLIHCRIACAALPVAAVLQISDGCWC